jgi:hypothetical protein
VGRALAFQFAAHPPLARPSMIRTSLAITWFAAAAAAQSIDAPPSQRSVHTSRAITTAFIANGGQWHPEVLHAARFGAMHVFLERAGFTVDLRQVERSEDDPTRDLLSAATSVRGAAVRFRIGEPTAVKEGARLPGSQTFLLGSDRSRWCSGVPSHASVRYEAIAPGMSLEAYGKDGHFEYDLLAAAGADLTRVTIEVAGAECLTVREDGSLAIATAIGTIVQSAPVAFLGDGTDRRVACQVELRGPNAFGFTAPGWNGREALRIDPGLTYGSYLGGSAADTIAAVAASADGRLTLAGGSSSMDFPITPGAYQTTNVNSDCILVRLDPSLPPASQIVSSTWYGGNGTDTFAAVHVDAQGIVTAFGTTRSTDLPVTANALQPVYGGGTQDAVLARFDLSQTGAAQLLYATYLGGSGNEIVQGPCNSLVVQNGVATVTGSTLSLNFPTTANAWSQTYTPGSGTDGFLARIDPSLPPASQLVYSTYFGGSSGDAGVAIDLDPLGRVAICGTTSSTNFPVTANAYHSTLGGPGDVVLMLWDLTLPPAQQIVYATYFGGSMGDNAPGMRSDRTGAFCFGGQTLSPDLPVTANAFGTALHAQDAYCARLDPWLPPAFQLTYCTYLGGTGTESGTAILVDAAGVITMSGGSTSTDFPVTAGAFQTNNAGGFQDTWVARIDPSRPAAQQLIYSTYLGGDGLETLFSLAADGIGGVWAVGFTQSSNFPTTPNGYDGSPNGGNDGFVAHLDLLPTGVLSYGASSPGCSGRLAASVTSMPRVGNASFSLTCTNLSPPAVGFFGISPAPAILPTHVLGIDVWVDTTALVTLFLSTAQRGIDLPAPIPANPALGGLSLAAQFAFYESTAGPTCPAQGWSASQALQFIIQP